MNNLQYVKFINLLIFSTHLREAQTLQNTLDDLGWNSFFKYPKSNISKDYNVARISTIYKDIFSVLGENGELQAKLAGKFFRGGREGFPVVGDWVLIKKMVNDKKVIIQDIITRKNYLSRKVSGRSAKEQIIASNIDYAFIVQGLDGNYNLRRLERYIVMTSQKGIIPVIILNKTDLCHDIEPILKELETLSKDYEIHPICCKTESGLDAIKSFFKIGITACFLGSSGVGKSSIVNKLMGSNKQKVGKVREADSKGRHITTNRQLLLLPSGGLVIDTPGMRELQLWEDPSQIESSFSDIYELSNSCYFKNCKHESEPRCNVKKAVEEGKLSLDRFNSYIKIYKETKFVKNLPSISPLKKKKKH